MFRWTPFVFFAAAALLVVPDSRGDSPSGDLRPHTTRDKAGNVLTGTLRNGEWAGPLEIVDPQGTTTNGTFEGGQWKGDIVVKNKSGDTCTGPMSSGGRDGLWKCHTRITDLTTYTTYPDGKTLKSFTEIEPHWATGNFEEVFRIRGKKPLLGINLKAIEENRGIQIAAVQLHSPAFMAGIHAGDIVTGFKGEPASEVRDLIGRIVASPFDEVVRIDVQRDGKPLALDVIPGTIPAGHVNAAGRPVPSSAERLWLHYRNKDSAEAYARYLEFVTESPYRNEATTRLKAATDREGARIVAATKSGNLADLASYVGSYPDSPLRAKAMAALLALFERSPAKGEAWVTLSSRCAACTAALPPEYAVLSLGPSGLTVGDILRLASQGIAAEILAAKIESSRAEYKDFSFEEIGFLNSLKVPPATVTAMIRSTHANAARNLAEENQRLKSENQALKEKKLSDENQRLQNENQKLRQQATQTAVPAESANAGAKSSVVEECVKMAAALTACDQAGGFLKAGCRAIAKSSFECPLPGYQR